MPPAQVVDIATVRSFVAFTLNATDTWAGALDDPKFGPSGSTGFLDSAILTADGIILKSIMSTPGHPSRTSYMTATAVTHGALLPEHIGPVGDILVDSKPAKFAPAETIQRWRDAGISYGTEVGYANLRERLYFLGTACTVDLCTYSRTAACQSPSIYTGAVQHLTLALIFKLGQDPKAVSHHLALAVSELQAINGGSDIVDKVLEQLKQE